jgi:hypothetical protein
MSEKKMTTHEELFAHFDFPPQPKISENIDNWAIRTINKEKWYRWPVVNWAFWLAEIIRSIAWHCPNCAKEGKQNE